MEERRRKEGIKEGRKERGMSARHTFRRSPNNSVAVWRCVRVQGVRTIKEDCWDLLHRSSLQTQTQSQTQTQTQAVYLHEAPVDPAIGPVGHLQASPQHLPFKESHAWGCVETNRGSPPTIQ